MRRSRNISPLALLFFAVFSSTSSNAQKADLRQFDEQALALLSKMSIEEKVGQMNNIGLMALATGDFWDARDSVVLDPEKLHTLMVKHGVGSVQNLGTYPMPVDEWRRVITHLQDLAITQTPNRIPMLYGIDAVHGANYTAGSVLFPHQIGLAATWNRDLVEQCAAATAYETRASGIRWNYAPVLDVARHSLWGRMFETFGEDSYVVAELGAAYVRGAQGATLPIEHTKTAVCLKHFWGYGHPASGKDRSPTYLPERLLRQIHLPPFAQAIEAGALSVMLNSGAINGVPAHANYTLISELLKGELGFDGVVISDWEDVRNLVDVHQVAENEKEAVRLAVNAGLDICMDPYGATFATSLLELIDEGSVAIQRVDDAVLRILRLKHAVGLFDDPYGFLNDYPAFGGGAHLDLAQQAALESITLLKNEGGLLPISADRRMLVTGYASNALTVLNGAWSRTWSGQNPAFDDDRPTIYTALKALQGEKFVTHVDGCNYNELLDVQAALSAAAQADLIVVCLGEQPATEKPSDIDNLELPQAQLAFAKALADAGKPMVLVLVEGRPRVISAIEPLFDAIVMAYLPGNEGGRAVADVLTGAYNPGGKLPMTYPRHGGALFTYDHTKADRRDGKFGFDGFHPQWEFGYGLSYTSFAHSNMQLSSDTLWSDTRITVSVDVFNSGDLAGNEVVQLYTSDRVASLVPSVRQLRGFEKVSLAPKETQHLSFTIAPSDLSIIDHHLEALTEAGVFDLEIGTQAASFVYVASAKPHPGESRHTKKPRRK